MPCGWGRCGQTGAALFVRRVQASCGPAARRKRRPEILPSFLSPSCARRVPARNGCMPDGIGYRRRHDDRGGESMPYDPSGSGMWFEWRQAEDGSRYRDWSLDRDGNPQVDPAFLDPSEPADQRWVIVPWTQELLDDIAPPGEEPQQLDDIEVCADPIVHDPPDDGGGSPVLLMVLFDRRAQIRRDRGYVGQAGPPPRLEPQKAFDPAASGVETRPEAANCRKDSASPNGNPPHVIFHLLFCGLGFLRLAPGGAR